MPRPAPGRADRTGRYVKMEIEVKYQTDQAQARQLFCHPLLAPYLGPAHQIPMQAV